VLFEAEASGGGGVRQGVSPTLPFPLSLSSPFPFPLSFQTNQWEGRSDPVRGKFPGFPPTNTTRTNRFQKVEKYDRARDHIYISTYKNLL